MSRKLIVFVSSGLLLRIDGVKGNYAYVGRDISIGLCFMKQNLSLICEGRKIDG